MKIKTKEAEALLIKAAGKFVSPSEAKYFARETIAIQQKKSHQLDPLKYGVEDIAFWQKNPKKKIKVLVDKQAVMLLDFACLGSTLKLKYMHDELEKRAKKYGIASLGFKNSAVTDVISIFSDGLAKRDLVGLFAFNGGSPAGVPFGGTSPVFGTNPISYSIPTQDNPVIVDMATTELPFFKYSRALKNKQKLPANTAVNSQGKITINPSQVRVNDDCARLLPMGGGHKGYNILFFFEVITGALIRCKMGDVEKSANYLPEEYGGWFMAIDIAHFTDINKFKKSTSRMCDSIRSQKPAPGVKQVLVPGDASYRRAKSIIKTGYLTVEKETYTKLKQLAE